MTPKKIHKKFKKVKAGEWQMPIMDGYKMKCCDCGLVHIVNFRIISEKTQESVDGYRVLLQAFREDELEC